MKVSFCCDEDSLLLTCICVWILVEFTVKVCFSTVDSTEECVRDSLCIECCFMVNDLLY